MPRIQCISSQSGAPSPREAASRKSAALRWISSMTLAPRKWEKLRFSSPDCPSRIPPSSLDTPLRIAARLRCVLWSSLWCRSRISQLARMPQLLPACRPCWCNPSRYPSTRTPVGSAARSLTAKETASKERDEWKPCETLWLSLRKKH